VKLTRTSSEIHLRNVLAKLPSTFDELSIHEFRKEYGEPETISISRANDMPLTANVPSYAVEPLYLGKKAQEISLDDAKGFILSDFGVAFCPATELRRGRECNTPLAKKAPEAVFELDVPFSFSSDIWSPGTAIWEILGMKFIISEAETQDEITAQQIDVLDSSNFPEKWSERLETQ
jgi:serine/threonine-protein kinase SRPK3